MKKLCVLGASALLFASLARQIGGLTPSECLGDDQTFRFAYRRRFRRFGLSIP